MATSLQAQKVLTIKQCREIAIVTNPNIKQSEQEIQAAQSAVNANKKDYLPQLDVSGQYQYILEPTAMIINGNKQEADNGQYNITSSLVQNIYKGGTIRKMNELSGYELNLTENNKASVEDEILYLTELRFWESIYQKELLNLADSYKKVIDTLVNVVKNKVEGELVNRSDLLLVEVIQNDVELLIMKVSDDHQISLMELKKAIGIKIDYPISLEGSLGTLTAYSNEKNLNFALDNRPEMAAQKELINIQEINIGLTSAKYQPSISAGVVPTWGAPSTDLTNDDADFNTTLMVGLSIPVVRWGKKKQEVNQQKFLKNAEEFRLEDLVNQISLEVRSADYQLKESTKRVELTSQSLVKAEENLQVMTDRYIEGLTSILEVLDAQIYWHDAFKNLLDAQRYYQASLSSYKKAIGSI